MRNTCHLILATHLLISSFIASANEEEEFTTFEDSSEISLQQDDEEEESTSNSEKRGRFWLNFGYALPSFDSSKLKYYKDLYGNPNGYPVLNLDWYFLNGPLKLGVGFGLGLYSDSGVAANTRNPTSGSSLSSSEKDDDSDLELKLIPIKLVLKSHFAPTSFKWVNFGVWAGLERLYVQESRSGPVSESDSDSDTYINSGWSTAAVYGFSVDFCLDFLDKSVANSLSILGFKSVYVSPFYEIVKTSETNIGSFDRNILGLLFAFESID